MIGFREFQPTGTARLYFDDRGQVSTVPTDLVYGEAIAVPDDLAITSVLQFGAVVPPMSPWKGVRRFVPGYQYDGTKPTGAIQIASVGGDVDVPTDPSSVNLSTAIEDAVDRALVEAIGDGPQPVLLFSGGVDSGFLGQSTRGVRVFRFATTQFLFRRWRC